MLKYNKIKTINKTSVKITLKILIITLNAIKNGNNLERIKERAKPEPAALVVFTNIGDILLLAYWTAL